jgi:hypothetical protein
MIIAYDIKWDVDMEDVHNALADKSDDEIAGLLGCDTAKYAGMTDEEKEDLIDKTFREDDTKKIALMGLPTTVPIPDSITDEEDIPDWLSDTYGFCHYGYMLKESSEA